MATPKPTTEDTVVAPFLELRKLAEGSGVHPTLTFEDVAEAEQQRRAKTPTVEPKTPEGIPVPMDMTLAEMRKLNWSDEQIQQVIDLQQLAMEGPTQRVTVPAPPPPSRPDTPMGTQFIGERLAGGKTQQIIEYDPITNTYSGAGFYSDRERQEWLDPETSAARMYSIVTSKQLEEKRALLASVAPEKMEEQELSGVLSSLWYAGSVFDVFRATFWKGLTYAGQVLPNPDNLVGQGIGWTYASLNSVITAENFYSNIQALRYAEESELGMEMRTSETFGHYPVPTYTHSPEGAQEYHKRKKEEEAKFEAAHPDYEEAREAFEEADFGLSEAIYERIATGKLHEEFNATYKGTFVGAIGDHMGTDISMARGAEVLNGLIPIEDAERLAELAKKAGDQDAYNYYNMLSTHAGREVFGLATEIIVDPLWWAGAAKGAKVITVGGETLTVGEDVVKAIKAVQEMAPEGVDVQRLVIDAMRGDEVTQAAALEKLQKAAAVHSLKAEAQAKRADEIIEVLRPGMHDPGVKTKAVTERARQEATRKAEAGAKISEALAESAEGAQAIRIARKAEAEKAVNLQIIADMNEKQARAFLRHEYLEAAQGAHMSNVRASQINLILDEAYDVSKVIQTAGAFRWHVPFFSKTFNPFSGRTAKINPVKGDTLASVSARTGINAPDLARLNKVDEARLANMITNGERITVGIGGLGMPEIMIAQGQKISDPFRPPDLRRITAQVAAEGTSRLSKGEKLAWHTMFAVKGFGQLGNYSLALWDFLSSFIRSRAYEPFVAWRDIEAVTEYFRIRGTDPTKIKNLLGTRGRAIVRLQRAAPELWNEYQSALGIYSRTIAAHTEHLMGRISHMSKLAQDIAAARVASKKAPEGTSGMTVLDEAVKYREQGRAFPEELKPLLLEMNVLVEEVAKRTGKAQEEVRQALQNIARFAAGDIEIARDLKVDIIRVRSQIVDITEEAVVDVQRVIDKQRQARAGLEGKITEIRQLIIEKKALQKKVSDVPNPDQLTMPERKIYDADIKSLELLNKKLDRLTPKKDGTVQGIGVLQKQIADLDKLERQLQKSLTSYRQAIDVPETKIAQGEMSKALSESLEQVRAKRQELMEMEAEYLKSRPKLIAERFKVGPDKSYARALEEWEVDLWDDFMKLSKPWLEKGELGEQAVYTALLGVFKREQALKGDAFVALSEQFVGTGKRTAVRKAPKQRTVEDTMELSKLEQEYTALAREEAELSRTIRSGQAIKSKGKLSPEEVTKARELEQVRKELGFNPDSVLIFMNPGPERDAFRGLMEREKELSLVVESAKARGQSVRLRSIQKRMAALEERVGELEGLEYAALRQEGVAQYPAVIGQRFMDAPKDLEPLIDELDKLLKTYQELYKKHFPDIVKDPIELMKIFGVAEYVPHLKAETSILNKTIRTGRPIEESQITGGMDSQIAQSLMIDASRYRALSGTIEELNALVQYKGDAWEFTMAPELLFGRLMNSSNGMASKEMLLTFLRTGVVRQFDSLEGARMAGFVPLFERLPQQQQYILDLDVLMMGTREELISARGTPVDAAKFEEMLDLFLKPKKEGGGEGPMISWAKDISDLNKMQEVEQTVGTIREILTHPQLSKLFPDVNFLDVQKLHQQISDSNHAAHLAKLAGDKVDIDRKIAKYRKQGKDIPRTVAEDGARLERLLDDTTESYLTQRRRIESSAWKEVSEEVNKTVSSVRNRARELPTDHVLKEVLDKRLTDKFGLSPLTPKQLDYYYNKKQPMMRMYVQESVQESLRSLTAETLVSKTPKGDFERRFQTGWKGYTTLNNFWKTRMTIFAVMFHARNAIGNVLSNILDIRVGGALNLDTNWKAGQLAMLVDYYATYGSLDKAMKALSLPKKAGEWPHEYAVRMRQLLELKLVLKTTDNLKARIDLGDGLLRTYDEALKLLTDNTVLSGTSNYRLDIDATHNFFLETAHRLSLQEAEGKIFHSLNWDLKNPNSGVRRTLERAEGAGYVVVGAMASGIPFPIAMPKSWGTALARRTENHARAVNFIGNMKRGKSVQESTEHVMKFLFNYSDLTPRQRDYLRTINPFFTWKFKNFNLHLEMMVKNPMYYANFNRLMYGTLPMLNAINEEEVRAERRGQKPSAPPSLDVVTQLEIQERVQYLPDYKLWRVRVPGSVLGLPLGYDVEGLGLPIESFAEVIHGLTNTGEAIARAAVGGLFMDKAVDPEANTRRTFEYALAQTHFLNKAIYVALTTRDPFYQESLADRRLRDANDLVNTLEFLRSIDTPESIAFAAAIFHVSGGVEVVNEYTKEREYFFDEGFFNLQLFDEEGVFKPRTGLGLASKYLIPNAATRAMREGALIRDVHLRSAMSFEAKTGKPETEILGEGKALIREPLPFTWRFLNATMGLQIKQQADSQYLQQRWEADQNEIIKRRTESLGITKDGRLPDKKK